MSEYPNEVSQYLKDKYDNAALGDLGQTQMNSAISSGFGGSIPETTTQTDLVKKEINNYLGLGRGTPAKKYNMVPGLVDSSGNSVLLNEETGEYGNVVEGKWTPTSAMPYNKNEIEITPYQQAQIDAQNRKNDIAEKRADSTARGLGGISAGLQYRMDHDAQEEARKETERKKKEEEELNNPKTSADQGKAATFAARLGQSEGVFDKLSNEGYDRAGTLGALQSVLPVGFQPSASQQQEQAERNFINATLRRESGAAINKDEFTSGELQYFPRAGDSSEVLAQKKQNREIVKAGLESEAGKAMGKLNKTLNAPQPVAASPAPHGQTVKQNGKTYNWDGSSYQEAK